VTLVTVLEGITTVEVPAWLLQLVQLAEELLPL
jgi:hypothetical protein